MQTWRLVTNKKRHYSIIFHSIIIFLFNNINIENEKRLTDKQLTFFY